MVICALKIVVFAVVHCHSCAKPIRRVQLQQPLIDNVRSNMRGKDTGERIITCTISNDFACTVTIMQMTVTICNELVLSPVF